LAANWLADGQHCEQYYYYHYDGLGSVIALSDSVGRTDFGLKQQQLQFLLRQRLLGFVSFGPLKPDR